MPDISTDKSEDKIAARTQVFMPLRSNASWFESPDTRASLECQIKINLMLYDRVIFQSGRWHVTAGFDAQGMEMPPSMLKCMSFDERRHIAYCVKGGDFGIQVGSTTLMRSKAEISLNADYYPILYDAGLLETACYDWCKHDSIWLEETTSYDTVDGLIRRCADVLPRNRYMRKCLVTGFIKDALLAQHLKLPMTVDYRVGPFILQQHQAALARFEPEMRRRFYDQWAAVELPDFGMCSWEEIIDTRDSQAGVEFRAMVSRVCQNVASAMAQGADKDDLDNLILRGIAKELIAEVKKRQKTPASTALSLLLNVIPLGGFVDAGMNVAELGTELNSWFGVVGLRRNQ